MHLKLKKELISEIYEKNITEHLFELIDLTMHLFYLYFIDDFEGFVTAFFWNTKHSSTRQSF